jgi:hypothetical protein
MRFVENPNITIKKVWANVDEDGMYLDIFNTQDEVKEFINKVYNRNCGYIQGFVLFDEESGFTPSGVKDFYYTYDEAISELNKEF